MSKKKDILFLCQFFYPSHNSSATLPFDTAKTLVANGFSVDALVGYPKEYNNQGKMPRKETVDGVNITRLKYLQLGRKNKISRLINYFSFTFSALINVIRLRKYKCVITYSNPPVLPLVPIIAKKLFKTQMVFVAYDVYPEVAYASKTLTPGGMIDRVMRRLNKSIYKHASMIVALTDEMKVFLLNNRPELSSDRITTIANWAHETKIPVTKEAYEQFGYSQDDFVVAYFGNMGICQEMETLLAAMNVLKNETNIKFLLVGHGNKKEHVEQYIKENSINNAQVYDFLTGEAFQNAVAVASCCVVSLEKGIKGMCAPSKYYSYLQGGKPILAVVESGSYLEEEIIKERIGASINIGECEKLSQIILGMCKSNEECKKMGERACELYDEKYDISIGIGKYEELFKVLTR